MISRRDFLKYGIGLAGMLAACSTQKQVCLEKPLAQGQLVAPRTNQTISPNSKESKQLGDNCQKEPDYVQTHFWTEIDQEGLKTHYTCFNEPEQVKLLNQGKLKYPKIEGLKGVFDSSPKEHGKEDNGAFKKRVQYDKENPRLYPVYEEKGLEEYIKDRHGNSLGILVSDKGTFYRFYDSKGYSTFSKEEIDQNPSTLKKEEKQLYDNLRLNNQTIEKIRKLRNFN